MTRPRLPLQAQEGQPGTHSACPSRRRGGDCGRELFKRTDAACAPPHPPPILCHPPTSPPVSLRLPGFQVGHRAAQRDEAQAARATTSLSRRDGYSASLRRVCALSANPPPPPGILSTTPELTTTGPQHGRTCTVAGSSQRFNWFFNRIFGMRVSMACEVGGGVESRGEDARARRGVKFM